MANPRSATKRPGKRWANEQPCQRKFTLILGLATPGLALCVGERLTQLGFASQPRPGRACARSARAACVAHDERRSLGAVGSSFWVRSLALGAADLGDWTASRHEPNTGSPRRWQMAGPTR